MGAKVMDREEIVAFLKENLTVKVEHQWKTTYEHASMTVKLMVDDEVISEDTVRIYE